MQLEENKLPLTSLISIILLVVLVRAITPLIFGYAPVFSPVESIILFGGVYFGNKRLIPFLAMLLSIWLGDILVNRIYSGQLMFFYKGFYWQYLGFLSIMLMGTLLQNRITLLGTAIAGLLSASLFFLISNFGVWMSWPLYPHTIEGLSLCYVAAIPFFKYTLLSNLLYCTLLYGCLKLMQNKSSLLNAKPLL